MLKPPKNIEHGLPFAAGILSKIREILAYLEQSRLIPGNGIRLMETPCGIVVHSDVVRTAVSAVPKRNQEVTPDPFEYTGPFSLYISNYDICCRGGIVWTPEACAFKSNIGNCGVPGTSKLVVLERSVLNYDSFVIKTIAEDPLPSDSDYWNKHALLGRYDAETGKITQYHFSPIVFLIETEDFVVQP